MIHKKQSGEKDCGLVTASMISNYSIRDVRRWWGLNYSERVPRYRGMTVEEMHDFLEYLTDRKWRVHEYGSVPAEMERVEKWTAPPGRSAVLIWPEPGHVGHWIATCDGVLYDPKDHWPMLPSRFLRRKFFVTACVATV
jgi:hypothetical protein